MNGFHTNISGNSNTDACKYPGECTQLVVFSDPHPVKCASTRANPLHLSDRLASLPPLASRRHISTPNFDGVCTPPFARPSPRLTHTLSRAGRGFQSGPTVHPRDVHRLATPWPRDSRHCDTATCDLLRCYVVVATKMDGGRDFGHFGDL